MAGQYINDKGNEVPENTIVVIPHALDSDGSYKEVLLDLKGNPKREWFNSHFYYCLPLTIGNQYGYVIKSIRDFTAIWDGTNNNAQINFINKNRYDIITSVHSNNLYSNLFGLWKLTNKHKNPTVLGGDHSLAISTLSTKTVTL